MNEERLEAARKRLTPEMLAAIQSAFAAGRMPRTLLEGISPAAVKAVTNDQASLESIVQLPALEAIIQRFGRPPLLVRGRRVELEPLPDFPPETDVLIKAAEHRVASVGRVEFINSGMSWGGTGWIVEVKNGKAIIVTNRHVAAVVARRLPNGRGVFMRSPSGSRYGAQIDFNEEVDSTAEDTSATVRVTDVRYLADDISSDVALLEVPAQDLDGRPPIELSAEPAKKGELVALIGYPAYDSRNNDADQSRYFKDIYEVKRFAPGLVTQAVGAGGALTHDCTSLGGNSGSPLIRLNGDDNKAVGLHFWGKYEFENRAVPADTIDKLISGAMPVSVLMPPLEGVGSEVADGHHEAKHFQGRKGFETDFLAVGELKTPWPSIPDEMAKHLAVPSDSPPEPNELRYTHFGVKYSSRHKLPLITAVNVDGQRSVRIKRGTDKWFSDGRIAPVLQLGAANFRNAEIDRGHMVRREDPNWSSSDDTNEALQANSDTFHYVNAVAQHSRLNQGRELWQGLENYILDNARTHGFRACVFTGPVMRSPNDDAVEPDLAPGEELSIDGAVVPLEFWKLVVTLNQEGTGLHATAYVLSQGQLIRKLLEDRSRRETHEGFVLGEYRTFQIAVSDLAEAIGYDLSGYIEADPLRRSYAGAEALERGEPVVLPLETLSDTRL
jgi:endonuclease G